LTGTQVTLDGWIRPTANTTAVYFGKTQSGSNDYLLLFQFNQLSSLIKAGGSETIVHTNFAPPLNQWTHVACTYDGNDTARIYINGIIKATNSDGGTLGKGGHGIGIAQNYPMGSHLVGLIDQLRLLNIARSAADICTDAGGTGCP